MQQFKTKFRDPNYSGTQANVQGCVRINDIDEIGDGHTSSSLRNDGLFSFREMTVRNAVDFWFDFLTEIGICPDTVTIHPDKFDQWRSIYDGRPVNITSDQECIWSDGEIGGYCTEFYLNGVEIGNIVNTNGDCIDVGFGLDRLLLFLGEPPLEKVEVLQRGILKIIESGYMPGNKQQGYVLRKLLKALVRSGGVLEHPVYHTEVKRQAILRGNFERLWIKHSDKSAAWWLDTHGIDLGDFKNSC
ncbi:unnamed protein product [Sphagnum tenellum]